MTIGDTITTQRVTVHNNILVCTAGVSVTRTTSVILYRLIVTLIPARGGSPEQGLGAQEEPKGGPEVVQKCPKGGP